ncbi:MAG TPA: class I SAM-dependent methyltransferase [Rhizomicrobium sp.]|nr:class I SAM-dependent methyltransferase [Rhizomicrobium sp.]
MPGLDTKMHVQMLLGARKIGQPERDGLYGLHWGNPDTAPALRKVRDHWLLPYVQADKVALEIGPGGGRWTRYMLPFKALYAVDYHAELLTELRKNFPQPNIVEVLNTGTDFPGVPPRSVDFVFTFGTFVHLDLDIVEAYLRNLKAVVKPDAQLVFQYPDKTKQQARDNPGFAENDPTRMAALVEATGYRIVEQDITTLPHSALMRFVPG